MRGELGALRVKKSYQVLNKTDIAVLVVDAVTGMTQEDEALLERIRDKQIPYVLVYNKKDLVQDFVCPQKTALLSAVRQGKMYGN